MDELFITTKLWMQHPGGWPIQREVVVIPKSVLRERMAANLDVFDFALTDDEMARTAGLDTGASAFNATGGTVGSHPDSIRATRQHSPGVRPHRGGVELVPDS